MWCRRRHRDGSQIRERNSLRPHSLDQKLIADARATSTGATLSKRTQLTSLSRDPAHDITQAQSVLRLAGTSGWQRGGRIISQLRLIDTRRLDQHIATINPEIFDRPHEKPSKTSSDGFCISPPCGGRTAAICTAIIPLHFWSANEPRLACQAH